MIGIGIGTANIDYSPNTISEIAGDSSRAFEVIAYGNLENISADVEQIIRGLPSYSTVSFWLIAAI